MQSGGTRAANVQLNIITHMHDFARIARQFAAGNVKQRCIRLAGAVCMRGYNGFEVMT